MVFAALFGCSQAESLHDGDSNRRQAGTPSTRRCLSPLTYRSPAVTCRSPAAPPTTNGDDHGGNAVCATPNRDLQPATAHDVQRHGGDAPVPRVSDLLDASDAALADPHRYATGTTCHKAQYQRSDGASGGNAIA